MIPPVPFTGQTQANELTGEYDKNRLKESKQREEMSLMDTDPTPACLMTFLCSEKALEPNCLDSNPGFTTNSVCNLG